MAAVARGWPGDWSGRRVRQAVDETLRTYGTECHLCGLQGADTADHLIPRSKGGGHDLANRRPAHRACNLSRQDMDLADWFTLHPLHRNRPALAPSREWT